MGRESGIHMEIALIGSSGARLQTNAFYLEFDEAANGKSTYAKPVLREAGFSRRLRVHKGGGGMGRLCTPRLSGGLWGRLAGQSMVWLMEVPKALQATEILSPR